MKIKLDVYNLKYFPVCLLLEIELDKIEIRNILVIQKIRYLTYFKKITLSIHFSKKKY